MKEFICKVEGNNFSFMKELIRCHECRYYHPYGWFSGWCELDKSASAKNDDDFCSYAKPKMV